MESNIKINEQRIAEKAKEPTSVVSIEDINSLLIEIGQIINEIAELNKQTVNTKAAIDSINALLRDSGFQRFSLRKKTGVANVYEVIREDGSVAKNLSEGERNFIAFLYFYNLVRGSQNSEVVKDNVVVIDDPVSSMDSSTLFIVGAIVRELITICNNNAQIIDDKITGAYIKQIFILTRNVYFHREVTYHQAEKYRSVSLYVIQKVRNVSTIGDPKTRPNWKTTILCKILMRLSGTNLKKLIFLYLF